MKKVILVICLVIGTNAALTQVVQKVISTKSDCASVTQRYLAQSYSIEQQLALESSPEELACLNYICARSYEFAPGQMVLRSQKELFTIDTYKHLRRKDQRVTVFDEYSGLSVVLYSWNEIEQALMKIRLEYQLLACD